LPVGIHSTRLAAPDPTAAFVWPLELLFAALCPVPVGPCAALVILCSCPVR